MVKWIKSLFVEKTNRQLIDEYLSDSSDLVDLERRMRQIDRGQAPWHVNSNLKGWV